MTSQKINPQKLIPTYSCGIYVPTEADLVFLGSNNLKELKQYWRREEREIVGCIKTVQAQIDILDGKTVDDVKAMAAEYEHPMFPKIGIREDNRFNDPEPLDEDSINRQWGVTTFNFCGWCKYCYGDYTHRNCNITATCTLVPKEFGNGSGAYGYDKFRFNTPCAITNGTQELLETCVKYLESKLTELVEKKAEASKSVRFIANAMKQAEEKPCLVCYRPLDWFKIGDEVVYFISDRFESALKKEVFVTGKVVDGFKHDNGFVSVCTDEKVHNDDYSDGRGIFCGLWRPEVMHRWEYEYLKSHPDYLKVWLRTSTAMFKSNSSEMAKAFAK